MPSSRASEWFKSSYSQQNGECVEVRLRTAGIDVRDSKSPTGAVVAVGAAAWGVFLGGAGARPGLAACSRPGRAPTDSSSAQPAARVAISELVSTRL
ncbi:DUF397 domain-containing protein [Streptomyces graminilatus]|uniref:DUF397 domain-containing protein n=1 Tax=Streptomyces graminilatus TaxID=1464070 RepID=UPI00099E874A